jgi:hypothetical protein
MAAAVALREDQAYNNPAAAVSRGEVLGRYRHLREISKRHNSAVLKFLSKDAVLQHARRLGLTQGKTLVLDDPDELNYAFDLAIHTAPTDRSRAIDRYARSARLAPGSDEALMLDAMCHARFAVLGIVRRHETAGLIVNDLFRERELWLVDIGLESSVPDGSVFATRIYQPEAFAMTGGVNVPVDLKLVTDALGEMPQLLSKSHAAALDDRRFAEAIYRVALAGGVMQRIKYQDPFDKDG